MSDEALDKCRQYIIDLSWTSNGTSLILTHRIRSFIFHVYNQTFNDTYDSDGYISVRDRAKYLNTIFPQKYLFQERQELPTKVIHILSSGRPRMGLRLCRMAGSYAKQTKNKGHRPSFIKLSLLYQIIKPFGRDSLRDVVSENKHQCPKLESVVYAFSRIKARFTTGELIDFVEDKIRSKGDVYLHGNQLPATSFQIAHLLFRMGFIVAVDYVARPRARKYYKFTDKPNLLRTFTNPDDGLCWIIHPTFAEALDIETIGPKITQDVRKTKVWKQKGESSVE